jgi:TldD protein
MSALPQTDKLFFDQSGMDREAVERLVKDALAGTDDGELFLEFSQSEGFLWDDGKLKSASFDSAQGFGLRAVHGETVGYAHASTLDEKAIRRAAETVKAVRTGFAGTMALAPQGTNRHVYDDINPMPGKTFEDKIRLVQEIDAYVRARDPRVHQVSVSLGGSYQAADEALRQALVNLSSVPAPAGEMPVVLGPGWPGILLHEAIGHGLEGDFNRKKTSRLCRACSASASPPRASRWSMTARLPIVAAH